MPRKKKEEKKFSIVGSFDTETTNYGKGLDTVAFCILYIVDDLRGINLKEYTPVRDDNIKFYRESEGFLQWIDDMIIYGKEHKVIPVVCAYNLAFDLQTVVYDLNVKYDMKCLAQSSSNIYTLDIMINEEIALRFWDCFNLEMRGLNAMGITAGLDKAKGSWDYSLVRTPKTKLTKSEYYYASRDVQIIPAYLKYLLNANEWLNQEDFGHLILTKTSLVRQMAQREIGNIRIKKANGKNITLLWAFINMCKRQQAQTFQQYALRKCCFRGGLTFTSAKYASKVVRNVVSLDVVSMHHAYINGRYIPVDFVRQSNDALNFICESIINTSLDTVLKYYHQPFEHAIHARIHFTNLRLKKNSAYDYYKLAIIPMGKFRKIVNDIDDYSQDERNVFAENNIRLAGWYDSAKDAIFAFGKLYSASECILHVSELELWCIGQVYDFDSFDVLYGESTARFNKPPDYVTLQSNRFFEMKNDAKVIHKKYKKGVPYKDVPSSIPDGIAIQLKNGLCSEQFFESYYTSTVKGMFNGIYGTMAQDVLKPDYLIEEGEMEIDSETRTNEENYESKLPKQNKVLYTYGLRIVGGSRMHLIISINLLWNVFNDSVGITGGDTDSLKITTKKSITNDDLIKALEPLHLAVKNAIDFTMQRVRKLYPEYASSLDNIGFFECEKAGKYDRYDYHMEAWNKARISIDKDGKSHITCAGLSRPDGMYNIENFVDDLLKTNKPEKILPNILGYNVYVNYDLSYSLEHKKPKANEFFDGKVTDYKGKTSNLHLRQATALYAIGRYLGDLNKRTNMTNVQYLKSIGNDVDISERFLVLVDGKPVIKDFKGDVLYA